MIRAIRSELTRLRNPYTLLGGVGLMTVLGGLATIIIFVTADDAPVRAAQQSVTVAALESSDGMFIGLQNAADLLGIVALAIWAIAVTTDYSSGLIRLLVQAEPNRLRLLGGKIVSLTALTCVATLVTTLVVLVISPAIASISGVSTDAWGEGLAQTIAWGYLDLTISALLWGVVGLFLGVLTRSTGIAVAAGIGYLLVFENLLGLILDTATKWLPGSSFSAVAAGGTADMTYTSALLLAGAYAAVAIAAAATVFYRRDITD
jgi:hypothetical protein